MTFIQKALNFQTEKEQMEDLINQSISKFNRVNNTHIEYLEVATSGWDDIHPEYEFNTNGILITWFEDTGRCGGTDYETKTQLIPYAYLDNTDNSINDLNQDKKRREDIKNEIENHTKERNSNKYKLNELKKEIHNISKINKKYNTNISIVEKEREIKELEVLIIDKNIIIKNLEKKI